jgi:hypothetical protein
LKKSGETDPYFGDIECVSEQKKLFDFNIGCGRSGDLITVLVTTNPDKQNHFDMYIQKGDTYFGERALRQIKVGELVIISDTRIEGHIRLCLEKDASCCGEEGESFVLCKI